MAKTRTRGLSATGTFKRRVYIDKEYKGIFEFPAGSNAHQVVLEQMTHKYGADFGANHTIVIAKLPEDGSTMPDRFKGAPAQKTRGEGAVKITRSETKEPAAEE